MIFAMRFWKTLSRISNGSKTSITCEFVENSLTEMVKDALATARRTVAQHLTGIRHATQALGRSNDETETN